MELLKRQMLQFCDFSKALIAMQFYCKASDHLTIKKGEVMPLSRNRCIRWIIRIGTVATCAVFATILFVSPAAAQSGLGSGNIEGTVTDSSGGAVGDAKITLRSDAT